MKVARGPARRVSLGLVHRLALAVCLALLTLYYPTHFWVPHLSGLLPEPPVWQLVAGVVVQVLALPIALVNRLHIPYLWGLDLWFPQDFGVTVNRQGLILAHLRTGILVYLALLYAPAFLRAVVRRAGR
jgi:uncharacterized membrane protein